MKFDITQYTHRYHAMHCPTEESAEIFCEYLESVGRRWGGGTKFTDVNNWSNYREDTCYAFNDKTYCNFEWFQENQYPILNFYDFEWGDSDERSEPKMTFDEVFWGAMQQNQSTI